MVLVLVVVVLVLVVLVGSLHRPCPTPTPFGAHVSSSETAWTVTYRVGLSLAGTALAPIGVISPTPAASKNAPAARLRASQRIGAPECWSAKGPSPSTRFDDATLSSGDAWDMSLLG